MGCIPVSQSQIMGGLTAGGAAVAAKILCMKFQEESQKTCATLEAKFKLETIEWKALAEAPNTEGEDVPKIFEKVGLKPTYDDSGTKLSAFMSKALKAVSVYNTTQMLTVLAVLMCKGKEDEKFEAFAKLLQPSPEATTVPGDGLKAVLLGVMNLALKDIPALAEYKGKDYECAPEDKIYTWWRGSFEGPVPKERLKKWLVTNKKFTTAEARDAAFRIQVAPIKAGEDPISAGGLLDTGAKTLRSEGISNVVKKFCNQEGFPKILAELEAKIRLQDAGWESLADAAEYCKDPWQGPIDVNLLMKVVRIGGLTMDYTDCECALAKFLPMVTENLQEPALLLAIIAAFLCKGDPLEKFEGIWLRLQDWAGGQKEVPAEKWLRVLMVMAAVAAKILPKMAGLEAEFADADPSAIAVAWWGGKGGDMIKKEEMEKWFFPGCKFLPCEARAAYLKSKSP